MKPAGGISTAKLAIHYLVMLRDRILPAEKRLAGHGINIASVATAFPSGMAPLAVKLDDTRVAVEHGANEIDMVISRGAFLQGEYGLVFDEIAAVKDACGDTHLKVILETGELGTLDRVRCASVLAMHAGADFIKTSTGKIQPAATMQVTLVMLQAIRDYYYETGRMVGMKPAGGISTAKLAIHYLVMLRDRILPAEKRLAGHGINIASVATAFPSGMAPLAVKLDDTRVAVEHGANEIDMVISRGAFLQGEYGLVFDEIAAVKDACGDTHLKVILETGELGTLDRVRCASVLAMHAGADFIKTSTGKIQPAATMQVTLVMLQAIRDYYYETGRMVGMKPAGGISTAKLAIHYLVMLRETLGNAWMTPEWFRFGASSLANDVLMQLMKQATGVYQSADYFSKD